MKILKTIFYIIMALIMALCTGVLVCAMTPSLTAMLAEKVENLNGDRPQENGGILSGLFSGDGRTPSDQEGGGTGEENPGGQGMIADGENSEPEDTTADAASGSAGTGASTDAGQGEGIRPGINADWNSDGNQPGYAPPDSQTLETPASVSGRTGYEPVQEEAQQILPEEADDLAETAPLGNTGSDYSFDPVYYPYYAMLEPDMRALYNQIYANALELVQSFAPVTDVEVNRLKTVFEAVYNDHPELFWLETGYSCKYLRSGKCVEITLKYNSTAANLEQARQEFESRAEQILSGTEALGSDLERERYLHDSLMQSVEYVVSAPMNQSAYSALVEGRSVCAGYARAFQYLMQQLGIPCYYCTGFAGEDHAWNIVKLGDGYSNVDVTWDDTDTPTYDYFNQSDREFASTHVRTGLAVYLPACVNDSGTAADSPAAAGTAGGNGDGETAEVQPVEGASDGWAGLINPEPTEPLAWQSRTGADLDTAPTEEERKREALEQAGIPEEDVLDTIQEYYEDCGRLLKEAGVGDRQFSNVIPKELWDSVEKAYTNGEYRTGYVDGALKELGVNSFVIQLETADIGGEYYRLYHNVYTY